MCKSDKFKQNIFKIIGKRYDIENPENKKTNKIYYNKNTLIYHKSG
jgi:hypothetical protein